MGNSTKRRLGDRRDGRRLRTLDPLNALTPYIMKVKSDASNYFSDSIEISGIESYLRNKRQQGYPGIGMLHLIAAAYVRVISQYPGINRFISGQRVYSRRDVEFVMTIKKEMKVAASETTIKVIFDSSDTIFDIFNKLNEEIVKVKKDDDATDVDDVAKAFMKLPRLILKYTVFFLTKLDYFGLLPKVLVNVSPFHGSVVITDLGSIGLPAIYHHLYNFGNIPVFIAIGTKRKAYEPCMDGVVDQRKYIDYKFTVDERICDGFYFSQAFKMFKSVLQQPEKLDVPPNTVVEDID